MNILLENISESKICFFTLAISGMKREIAKLNFFHPKCLSLKDIFSIIAFSLHSRVIVSFNYIRHTPGLGTPWQIMSTVNKLLYSFLKKHFNPAT